MSPVKCHAQRLPYFRSHPHSPDQGVADGIDFAHGTAFLVRHPDVSSVKGHPLGSTHLNPADYGVGTYTLEQKDKT